MPPSKTLITVPINSLKPMKVHVPTSVRRHNIKLVTFRHQYKEYANVEVCCFIFYPPIADCLTHCEPDSSEASHIEIKPARLLLFQRNLPGTRIHDLWDVPGGGPKHRDPTILHAVARNTFETTRLRTKSIPMEIGYGEKFKMDDLQCFKLNFMVEVEELAYDKNKAEYPSLDYVRIEFDEDEHQRFVWATEQEIKDDIYVAVTPKQKEVILLAFRLRRDDEEELRDVAIQQEELKEEKRALAARREQERKEQERKEQERKEQKRKEQRTALAAMALTVKARELSPEDYATAPEEHGDDGYEDGDADDEDEDGDADDEDEDGDADDEDEDDYYRKLQWSRRPRLGLPAEDQAILTRRRAKSDLKTQDDNKEDNKGADKDEEEGSEEEGSEEEDSEEEGSEEEDGEEEGGEEEGSEEEDDKSPPKIVVYRPPSGNRPALWQCDPKPDEKVRRSAQSDVKTKDDDKKDNKGHDQGRGPQAGRFGLKRHREDDEDDEEQGGWRGPPVGQWNISTGKLVRKGRR